ncbi:phosphoglyceromutase [Zhouia spongiae]|uniref:Phosphoglyceromutase n=1 Tax=Zhouia spongiae TaxID=2202721 RepID=A0ABY3YKZ5_9FLAO|nr:phosphoglyceromutase [Zhouia spongiae]UNY97833.1 phosphoglyceromutase [Zhouia spongiae]
MKMRLLLFLFAISFIGCENSEQEQNKVENIVLISIDGLRWQEVFKGADSLFTEDKHFWANTEAERRQKLMPFFWNTIAQKGQLYGNRDLGNKANVKNKYWFSYPGRSEALCGYYDPKVNLNEYPNNPNENVLEFIDENESYKGKVVTFASWEALGRVLNRDRNGMLVNLPGEDVQEGSEAQNLLNELQHLIPEYHHDCRPDELTYMMAKAYIQDKHPKVVYLDFGDTDIFAHDGEYGKYLDATNRTDKMISDLWESLQNDPFYKDKTALLVYTDHGRGIDDYGWKHHGDAIPGSDEVWLAALGPGIPNLGEVARDGQIYQDQIAQTAANILGFTFEADHPVGNSIEGVFVTKKD